MTTYRIEVEQHAQGWVEVEADALEDAKAIAKEGVSYGDLTPDWEHGSIVAASGYVKGAPCVRAEGGYMSWCATHDHPLLDDGRCIIGRLA